jgi:hypothetical protein
MGPETLIQRSRLYAAICMLLWFGLLLGLARSAKRSARLCLAGESCGRIGLGVA